MILLRFTQPFNPAGGTKALFAPQGTNVAVAGPSSGAAVALSPAGSGPWTSCFFPILRWHRAGKTTRPPRPWRGLPGWMTGRAEQHHRCLHILADLCRSLGPRRACPRRLTPLPCHRPSVRAESPQTAPLTLCVSCQLRPTLRLV